MPTTSTGIPVSNLINIQISLAQVAAQGQSLNNLLLVGTSPVIDLTQRMRNYATLSGVASDFPNTSPEYLAAVLWFEQMPQPTSISIGRWANAAVAGQLVGAPLSAAQQLISAWTGITTPTFTISINGTSHAIAPASFAAQTNLNGIASLIQTALAAALAGSTCVWNATTGNFVITSGTTGASSTVSFATPTGTGTDISGMLGMLASSSGAYAVPGQVAESALTAVQLLDTLYGGTWYGVVGLGFADSDVEAVASYIEGSNNKHYHGVTTQEAGVLVQATTSDLAYVLKQFGYNKTGTQYSSTSPYAVVSMLSRILTTDWGGNNTAITLGYKQEPGIVPETLTPGQLATLHGKNANVIVNYANDTAILDPIVVSASGQPIDTIIGLDWFATTLQTQLYNRLYLSPTKIPQTDAGNHILATDIETICQEGVNNGLFAPGIWQNSGFGAISEGQYLPKGFYVYQPPVSGQTPAVRATRVAVAFQVALVLAGSVEKVNVSVTITA